MNILNLIGRTKPLLGEDINDFEDILTKKVQQSSFCVIGGAGSIGQAVTKEIFFRAPKKLHVVDISENNLVELVRDIRSSFGYTDGDFKTFALDCGSIEFEAMFRAEGTYDYVLNLSALKHVRSEEDPYTLMRMIKTNIINTIKTIDLAIETGAKKYFCVSTDKAANPVNMMGGSKRIMEMYLIQKGKKIDISTARFANVAFSDGSLLHGFNQRLLKKQPIAAPNDVRRYFVTPKESGELCLISTLLGDNGDIVFPKLNEELNLVTFSSIAQKYLKARGFEAVACQTEDEARKSIDELAKQNKWPCAFFPSNTAGEKDYEAFFVEGEELDLVRFKTLGIVKNNSNVNNEKLANFLTQIEAMKASGDWKKDAIVELFFDLIPNFSHQDNGKYLDSKM